MDYDLPLLIQTGWIFGVFLLSLVAFHLVLVYWLKLGKTAWKRVDYIWLAVGALGIFAALEKPRETVARNLQEAAEERLQFTYSRVKSALAFGLGPAVCTTFNSSPMLTESERANLQRGFDTACAWFKSANAVFVQPMNTPSKPIALSDLPPKPTSVPPGAPQYAFQSLTQATEDFNSQLSAVERLKALRSRTELESVLAFLAPFLIAVALALRITKVTGELRLGT